MWRSVARFGLALAAVVAAVGARALLDPILGDNLPLSAMYAAVAYVVWLCGWRIAALAAVAGYVLSDHLFLEPRGILTLHNPETIVRTVVYALTTGIIIAFGERMGRAQRRAADAAEAARDSERRLRSSSRELSELVDQIKDYAIFRTDMHGRATTWNQGVKRVLGFDRESFLGRDVSEAIFTDEDRENGVPQQELETAARDGVVSNNRWMRRKNGEHFFALGTTAAIYDGQGHVVGFSKVMRDHTALKQTEIQLRQSEERLRRAAAAAQFGTFDVDLGTGEIVGSPEARAILCLADDEPFTLQRLEAAVHPDDREHVARALRGRIESGGGADGEFVNEHRVVQPDDHVRWVLIQGRVTFEDVGEDRRPVRATGVILDITGRKAHEEQMRRVMAELNHRIKNTLAVIQSIASQSVRRAPDLKSFERSFRHRLESIAAVHTLLTRAQWEGASLRDIIRIEAEAHEAAPDRFHVDGPAVMLRPKAALALHMIVHELATNASKYGALYADGGIVEVRWDVERGEREVLRLTWTEHCPHQVTPPAKTGFGTHLIDQLTAYELNGQSQREYRPSGLHCHIEFPLRETHDGAGTATSDASAGAGSYG